MLIQDYLLLTKGYHGWFVVVYPQKLIWFSIVLEPCLWWVE